MTSQTEISERYATEAKAIVESLRARIDQYAKYISSLEQDIACDRAYMSEVTTDLSRTRLAAAIARAEVSLETRRATLTRWANELAHIETMQHRDIVAQYGYNDSRGDAL